MAKKERLDNILVDKGFFETKSKAQAAIMAGDVVVNDEKITKAGFQLEFKETTKIEVKTMPFVSRGGFKLDKAVKAFDIHLKDKVCLDAGASTGGFTDCMLQNGAKKVYSVDVGYGQIAWKLRNDDRVKVIERVNIRNCSPEEIYSENDEKPTFCAMDLSFISITKVLENILKLMQSGEKTIMALIKPQFEAGKDEVGKNGVVREKETHIKVIKNVIDYASSIGLYTVALDYSPIKGPAGNIEYIVLFSTDESKKSNINIEEIVQKSEIEL